MGVVLGRSHTFGHVVYTQFTREDSDVLHLHSQLIKL